MNFEPVKRHSGLYANSLTRQSLTTAQNSYVNIIYQSEPPFDKRLTIFLDLIELKQENQNCSFNFHFSTFLDGIIGLARMKAEQKDILLEDEAMSPLPVGVQADKRLGQV